MDLNELNLNIRTYNAVKRAGIETVEQLIQEVETERFALLCGHNAHPAAQALKSAGLVQFIRGDDVPTEQLGCELELEELAGHIGEVLAVDISTETHKWYRAVTIYKITDERILYHNSYKKDYPCSQAVESYRNRKKDRYRSGGFFLIQTGAAPETDTVRPAEIIPMHEAALADGDAHSKAVQLHRRIKADWQIIGESFWDMCVALKEMRDGKHYQALLYANFEGYCEQEFGLSRPQAYRYISIAENMTEESVSSMRQIGMTKLALLATVTEEQRAEITQTIDLESTTVRELKAQIDALNAAKDYLQKNNHTLSQAAYDARKEAENSALERKRSDDLYRQSHNDLVEAQNEVRRLERQIKVLESRPVDVAVQTDEAALEQLRQAYQAEIAQLKAKHREQLAKAQQTDSSERIAADILRGQFDAKHSVMQTAADDLLIFINDLTMSGNPQMAVFIEKTKKTLREITKRLNDIIMEGENAE